MSNQNSIFSHFLHWGRHSHTSVENNSVQYNNNRIQQYCIVLNNVTKRKKKTQFLLFLVRGTLPLTKLPFCRLIISFFFFFCIFHHNRLRQKCDIQLIQQIATTKDNELLDTCSISTHTIDKWAYSQLVYVCHNRNSNGNQHHLSLYCKQSTSYMKNKKQSSQIVHQQKKNHILSRHRIMPSFTLHFSGKVQHLNHYNIAKEYRMI